MFKGGNDLKSRNGSELLLSAKFNGRGASNGACPAMTSTGKGRGFTLARTAAGTYVATFADGSKGVDITRARLHVVSATLALGQLTSYSASAGTLTFSVTTPSTAAAFDPISTDEIWLDVGVVNSVAP